MEIERLLIKYHAGETTEEEEKILKDFFMGEDVPPGLAAYSSLFTCYSDAAKEKLEEKGFEEKVIARINFDSTPVIPLHTHRRRIYFISAVAASILLLISMVFLFVRENQTGKNPEVAYSYEQQEIYAQAHDILSLVSVNLNRGIEKAAYLGKFDDALQKMEMLSKYYQYQSLIINPDQLDRSDKTK